MKPAFAFHGIFVVSLTCTTEYKSAKSVSQERLSIMRIALGLSVLLTSGLIVQECDATMLNSSNAARLKKISAKKNGLKFEKNIDK